MSVTTNVHSAAASKRRSKSFDLTTSNPHFHPFCNSFSNMDTVVDEEEEVHSFADDEEMEVKFSIDEADVPVPGPIETGANSRFLSSDLSASRSPRFSNPTMERQSSFKYRRSNRVAENYRSQEAPEVKVAMDPRQAHQSSYDEVETRVRTAPPTISLKKSGSPSTPKYSPRNSNRTAPASGQHATPQTPKSVPASAVQAHHASPHVGDSPASNVTGPEESSGSVVSPASATALATKKSTPHAPTRSPQPAPTTRTSVTKRPVAEPSSANKRHSAIPTPQRAAFGGLAAKSPAPAVSPTPAVPVHKTVKPATSAKPTTELLSPIRARNFEEALKSAVSRSSTPTSLQRPRYSVDNLAIHAPATPTVSGKDWNGSVRVKKPNPNLEAQEHLDLLKRDSGEKALTRTGRRQPGGEGLTAQNLNNHRQNGENSSAFSHGSHQPGTPSSLFSPVSQRKYGEDRENGQRSVSSRSNTPTSLRPSSRPSSRPTSRSTTPTNASAARRGPNATSLGQYFNTDEMTEISGHDSQAGDRLQRNAPSASGSLLSPYNLMVEGTHDRALDSASLSDKDLQSVAKQMLLLRLMLQAKNAADAEKEEADILHAWQVVHDAEEQAHLMASQDSGIEEISRTHQHILDMERMVDELNDHLAPVFERLSAYRTLKEAQNATSSTTTGTDADGTVTPPPADPLLDAYSERAQAHKELQTRLAGLAKSIAALKKTVDKDGFVRPSEEALAMLSAAEQENAMSEEDSHHATAGYRKAPAVNPVRVQAGSAAPDAERSRSSSPAPTRRLSLVERQTLNREAMAAKNAQLREAEHAATAPPAPPVRSKSPAVAGRGGTTTFSVPAAARPTAASIAGTVRAKSPAPATAAAARSKSPAPAARAKSPGPASAGAAKRLNRAPAVAVSAALEDAVGEGKQPRSVPRAKKPEPAVEPTPEPTKVPSATEDVETAAEESVQGYAEICDVVVENTTDPEVVVEDRASEGNASSVQSVSAPVVSSEADKVEVLPAVKEDTSVEVAAPATLSAVLSDVEVAPVVWKEEATDAHLNNMFVPPVSPNSVDGTKNTVLPTPPLSPMTPGPSNTDAFNPALIAAAAPAAAEPVTVNVDAESTVEAPASPSKKAAFERLMKRLNSNKEGNSAGNSSRTSPVVTPVVSETNEVPIVASSAAGGTTASVTVTASTSTSAGAAASTDEPITRRLSVAEMRAQFSGGAAKEPLRPAAVAAASAAAPVVAPAVVPVVAPVPTPVVANTAAVNVSAAADPTTKDLTVDILSAEAVTVEYNDNSPVSQDGATASLSPFRRGEVKVPALPEVASPVAPSGVSPMKRVQSTRVSELMNKFGGSRKDVTPGATSPSPAAAPAAPAVTRNASVRGSIASITGINIKRSVFEKGELNTGSDVTEGEAGETNDAKSPSSANKRSKSPASLSRNGSSNNLAAAAGGSLSPKSPGSNPASPVSKLASSLKSVLSFTKGSSSKNAAASADAAEEEIAPLPIVASDSATTGASANDAVKESMSPAVSEPLPVPTTPSAKEAPPSYEESSVDVTPTNTFVKLTANTSVPAVPVEAGVGTPLSSRAPASARTPGTARTVILASPEQLPANLPFASSPSTVELLQAAASSESDGSLDWGVDGTYSHSLQVSRSEEFIHTANTFQPPLQTVTEAEGDGEGEGEGEKEEDLTSVVSAQLTAQFQANKSSENVLAAMEAEQKEPIATAEVAKQEPAAEVSVKAANGASEEEDEGLVLDFNTIETSIKASPTRHTVPAVKAPAGAVTSEPAAAAITTSTTTPAAVTTTATVSDDSKTNSPNDSNGNGAYSRVQSGRFSAVDSDVSMSAPPTPLPATSFTNVTSSVKVQHPPASISASAAAEGVEGEGEGDFNEGDFGADNDASETASNAGSTATNGSKKHRRPTLKGLWKRIGGSGKQKPGTEL